MTGIDFGTKLEISGRAFFWETKFAHYYGLLIDQKFNESSARKIAAERADAAYQDRFPFDYLK